MMTSAACITATTATTTSRVSPRRNPAHAIEAGIVGGSGFTGALLAELLLGHPSVKLTATFEALVGSRCGAICHGCAADSTSAVRPI